MHIINSVCASQLTIGQDAVAWEDPSVQCGTWQPLHSCETKEAFASAGEMQGQQ